MCTLFWIITVLLVGILFAHGVVAFPAQGMGPQGYVADRDLLPGVTSEIANSYY